MPLSPCPGLVFATFLGGDGSAGAGGVDVDSVGHVYVVGTAGPGFLATPGADDATPGGNSDAFLAKFSPAGVLVFATLLGGIGWDNAFDVATDPEGNVYVVGNTESAISFPTTPGAPDRILTGSRSDGFVTKFDAAGHMLYSTFLGGTGDDRVTSVGVDPSGNTYVAGWTNSADFPTTEGSYSVELPNQGGSGFIAKLNPAGTRIEHATFFPILDAIAVDPLGSVYAVGTAYLTWQGPDVPATPGAFDTTIGGECPCVDAYVAKLKSDGTALAYSTYLGGSSYERGTAITVDENGIATVVGISQSDDFPTTSGAFDNTGPGAFVTRLSPDGDALVYSTFLGPGDPNAITIDSKGNAYVAGTTEHAFPTTLGAFDATPNGGTDVFLTVVNPVGTELLYSTLVGGSGDAYRCVFSRCSLAPASDDARDIAVDAMGNLIVTGSTDSVDFPTFSAFDPGFSGVDGFLLKLEPLPEPNRSPVAAFTISPAFLRLSDFAVERECLLPARLTFDDLSRREYSNEYESPYEPLVPCGRAMPFANQRMPTILDASMTDDPEDPDEFLEYRWDWEGDGVWDTGWSRQTFASHDYRVPDTYTIRLEVRDSQGLVDTANGQLVLFVELASVIAANPASGVAPLTVRFTNAVTGEKPPFSYAWDFGDGSPIVTRPNPVHTYTKEGTYEAKLTVTDDIGTERTSKMMITVSPALVADATAERTSGVVPLGISFNGTASGGTPPYAYAWEFDDGSVRTNQNVSHTFGIAGYYEVTLTVVDAEGRAARDVIAVSVAGLPPRDVGEGAVLSVLYWSAGATALALGVAAVAWLAARRRR